MKKICVAILSMIMLLTVTGIMTVGAEGDTYTYERNEDILSEAVYQDFEDLEPMEDYATTKHEADVTGRVYGFFSHVSGGGSVMITNENPITGDQSIRFKDLLDARRWTIDAEAEFDADAYVLEFKIRIDDMPAGGKFAVKISDVNSKEHDNEGADGPILSIKNVDGKIGLYNLSDKLLTEVEANKVYTVAIVCETLSSDYYVFLDGKYIPDSKAKFNVEFAQLTAFRFDLSGTGTIITMDDIVADGCEVGKGSGSTAEATSTPEATEAPTKAPTSAATVTPKPATPAPTNTADSDSDGGFPTWAIAAIAAGVVVIVAVVVVVVVKKKKK